MSVKPIAGRKLGEFARLLEERGFGDEDFQRFFIENMGEVIANVMLSHLALRNAENNSIEFPIKTDLITLSLFATKGYLSISKDISLKGLAGRDFTGSNAVLIRNEWGSVDLEYEQVRLDAMGLRFGDVCELVAFEASYPKLENVTKSYAIFAPKYLWGLSTEGNETIAISMVDEFGKRQLFTHRPLRGKHLFTSSCEHFLLAFRK